MTRAGLSGTAGHKFWPSFERTAAWLASRKILFLFGTPSWVPTTRAVLFIGHKPNAERIDRRPHNSPCIFNIVSDLAARYAPFKTRSWQPIDYLHASSQPVRCGSFRRVEEFGFMDVTGAPHQAFQPNVLLGWSLTPNSTVDVHYRDGVVQTINSDGWRNIPSAGSAGPKINLYGCSWTYGTGLSDDETLAQLLQVEFPSTQFRNRGCGGYGTVHNYIQFRQDLTANDVDIAVFLVISDHRFRNTPHPRRWKSFQRARWDRYGVTRTPIARQARNGKFQVTYVPITQPATNAEGLNAFLPSDFMLDRVTFATLRDAYALAQKNNIQMVVAVLDSVDMEFNRCLLQVFDAAIDISVPFDKEHFWLPHDSHPNVHANVLFSQRLKPHITSALDKVRAAAEMAQ